MRNTHSKQRIGQFQTHFILPFRLWRDDTQRYGASIFEDAQSYFESDPGRKWKPCLWHSSQHSNDIDPEWDNPRDYQAYSYFHPFVRCFLYSNEYIHRYQRNDIKTLQIKLSNGKEFKLEVKRCQLMLFKVAHVALLHLTLKGESTPQHPILLEDVQRLHDELRRIYPPYFDDYRNWKGGHYPLDVKLLTATGDLVGAAGGINNDAKVQASLEDARRYHHPQNSDPTVPLSYHWDKHWAELLKPLSTEPPQKGSASSHSIYAVQLGDDRAALCSYIAFESVTPRYSKILLRSIDPGNWVRLCFADAPGQDELPYSRQNLEHFERDYCYDRWWYVNDESSDSPSRILNCGYAFIWAGNAEDNAYFANPKYGAPAIFEHIYVPMALIAHFQQAALLTASSYLSELSSSPGSFGNKDVKEKFEAFYGKFLRFTQIFWFDEISPQIQGIELFEKWRKHLRIQKLYDEVRQELHDVVEYFDMREAQEHTQKAQKQTEEANKLTKIATYIALPSLVASIISMFASIFGMTQFDFKTLSNDQTVLPKFFYALLIVATPTALWSLYHVRKIWIHRNNPISQGSQP